MKKSSISEILVPALVLFIICAVITALLAGTNRITSDRIQQLTQQAEDEARRRVLPQAESFTETDIPSCFAGRAEGREKPVGYVFITESNEGYGGKIRVMTGIGVGESGGEATVTGVEILEQEETPGLGANAQNESFTDQFRQPITGESGFALYGEQMGIDALTGATITSRAVVEAVNQALAEFERVEKEVAEE